MLLILVFIAGFALGWFRASRAGGDRLDRLQYGAAHAIALTLAVFIGWIAAIQIGLF